MRPLALALLLVATGAAAAPVVPPAGWARYYEDSGQPRIEGLVEGHLAPDRSGALYVTRRVATTTAATRDADAHRLLVEIVKPAPGADWALGTRVLDEARMLQGSGHSETADVRAQWRAVVASDGERIVALLGECVHPPAAPASVVGACTAALASLDPDVPVDRRVVLAMVTAPPQDRAAPAAQMTSQPGAMQLPQTQLSDGEKIELSPRTITNSNRERDHRPVYLGIGVVILAAVFWWNRRRREQFDTSDKPAEPQTRADDDSNDLQAAARGDKDQP